MRHLGVYALTGEACGFGMRLLCDLSPEAAKAVAAMWDVPVDALHESWNHGGKETGWRCAMFFPDSMTSVARWIIAYVGWGFSRRVNPYGESVLTIYETMEEFKKAYGDSCEWFCGNCSNSMAGEEGMPPDRCDRCGRERAQLSWLADGWWRAPSKDRPSTRNTHQMSGRTE